VTISAEWPDWGAQFAEDLDSKTVPQKYITHGLVLEWENGQPILKEFPFAHRTIGMGRTDYTI
jgi:hypothetical protein